MSSNPSGHCGIGAPTGTYETAYPPQLCQNDDNPIVERLDQEVGLNRMDRAGALRCWHSSGWRGHCSLFWLEVGDIYEARHGGWRKCGVKGPT